MFSLLSTVDFNGVAFGGRIPNYHKYADQMPPKEYIENAKRREIQDFVLNFQMSNDFHPSKILKLYLQGNKESCEYAVLLEWNNIYHGRPNKKATTKKKIVQLVLIQWQTRP